MKLTPNAWVVLSLMLWDIRVAILGQFVRALLAAGVKDEGSARRVVRSLTAAGLLGSEEILARPVTEMARPVYSWRPEAGRPDYAAVPHLSYLGLSRWKNPPTAQTVFFASAKATRLFGGVAPGRVKSRAQVTHDLHVTEVVVSHFLACDEERSLVSEDRELVAIRFQKRPDAILYDLTARPPRPVEAQEILGAYPEEKIRDFFADMERRQLAFNLW